MSGIRALPRMGAVLLLLALAALALAACGGSSSKSSTGTNAAKVSSTGSGTAAGNGSPSSPSKASQQSTKVAQPSKTPQGAPGAPRFAALRECLRKNGVTMPKPNPGTRRGLLRNRAELPNGVTRKDLQSALLKCGGGRLGRSGPGSFLGTSRSGTPTGLKKAFAKFAQCMRSNGVAVAEPNLSGKGPIFNTKGIDTNSAKFRAATKKCRTVLTSSFPRRTGPPGQPPAGGAPSKGAAPSK